ncbi:family 1 encapsulin nanocompartment shell protein [Sulfobacillus sp. hq2]|uniref:family 1 encapsulin nanocompartment shell protein n=1 Tax=Sulfobacillus sp. hq2 TaxID=2039167 RepID=UPI000CD30493|nr:family 1 encapsulin nanocompartment shell protein [Sulfobacillus sp. hq2]POB11131.1 bacteriocin [Sulfobacillus sp. hq2]
MEFLQRDQAPLNEREWALLDEAVRRVIAQQVTGRRFLSLFGPVGSGVQVIPVDRTPPSGQGQVDMVGETNDAVRLAHRLYQKIPLLHRDFLVFWRDIESARAQGIPIDWSMAEAAASLVAQAEDRLILEGDASNQIEGLLTVSGRQVLTPGEEQPNSGFHDVVRAINVLSAAGFYPPYTVVVGPELFATWHRLYGNTGVLEIEQIRKLAEQGVYVSPLMPTHTVLVLAAGAENMDLAIGIDAVVGYVESTSMNHRLRVLETLTLRIKRPAAICHIAPANA